MSRYGNDFKKSEEVSFLMGRLQDQVTDEKDRDVIDLSNMWVENLIGY